jgi:glycosyltransferase involved in cell wall biosynthesis
MPVDTSLLRIAFVVPRYLPEMVGGAETLLQGYAEQLAERGYPVEVFTTCADQLGAWENALQPGEETIRGVRVRRFPIDVTDPKHYWRLAEELSRAGRLDYGDQLTLLRASLNSAALCGALGRELGRYDAVIIGPYAFGLAFGAARAAAGKAIWVPCLHDEPMAHMAVVREALEEARGILFNADAEERFARERLGLINPSSAVVGYGFAPDSPRGDGARFRARHGLHGPFILYAGRIIPEKNAGQLLDLFERYHHERDPNVSLVLVGEGGGVDTARPGVRALGRVSAEDLRDAYAAAELFCQPSRNESFSIVIMESWLQGRPALVHAACDVTREHVERSGGGWAFADFASFAAAVSAATGQPEAARERGDHGRAYVREQYAWPIVAGRLERALTRLAAARPLAAELSQRGVRRALEFTRERYHARLGDVLEEALPAERRLSVEHLLAPLRQSGDALPPYRVESRIPVVGPLIAWARRQLTAHLKEPYVDAIARRQAAFDAELVERVQYALEHALREQRRMERRIRFLEAELKAARHDTDSSDVTSS